MAGFARLPVVSGEVMRIISGEARGRTLFAPPGDQTRPTSDKIRGSLFNILNGRVEDAQVLDLSKVIGYGINWALQGLEIDEITALLS